MTATITIKTAALSLADATRDAYSFDRYGIAQWLLIADRLLTLGYTAKQAEDILRSKHMRWAADSGEATHETFLAYYGKNPKQFTQRAVAALAC